MADPNQLVTLGIDTHAEVHAVAALDERGRLLDSTTIPTSLAGFQALLEWAAGFGTIDRIGVEGTGSYGAGVARWLRAQGLVVIEVDRPDRAERRRRGKSDPIDAEVAARAVQSGRASGTPKAGDGRVEAIRALRIARSSALDARSRVANQLHALRVTAPDKLREELRGLSLARLSLRASRFRVPTVVDTPLAATRLALRSLAQRFQQLSAEMARLDVQLAGLVAAAAPQLVARPGIGTQIAAQLLVTAGDNPTRLRQRRSVRHAGRHGPNPGLVRQDRAPASEPRWRPPGQLRALHAGPEPPVPRPAHPGLCSATDCRGQDEAGDHALPEALSDARGVSAARPSTWLTDIEASIRCSWA
jgi:transposase